MFQRGVLLSLLADAEERQRRVRGAKMNEFETNMETACTEATKLTKRCEKRLQQLSSRSISVPVKQINLTAGDIEGAVSVADAEAEARESSFVAMMNRADSALFADAFFTISMQN